MVHRLDLWKMVVSIPIELKGLHCFDWNASLVLGEVDLQK